MAGAQVDANLVRFRNFASWVFGAALLAYEAWDVRKADAWLVLAALALMAAPLAQAAIDSRRRPPAHRREWAPPYDQDAARD